MIAPSRLRKRTRGTSNNVVENGSAATSSANATGCQKPARMVQSFVENDQGTVVIASHNIPLCTPVCESAVVLRQGQVALGSFIFQKGTADVGNG